MTVLEPSTAYQTDDRTFTIDLLKRLLDRRRHLVPWPLTELETPLLWWPTESYGLLTRLKSLGTYDGAFDCDATLRLKLPPSGSTKFSCLLVKASSPILPTFVVPGAGPIEQFMLIDTGEVAEKFDGWFQKARVIHAWNLVAVTLLAGMMHETNSWGQLRKAFPEMYDALSRIEIDTSLSWKYGHTEIRVRSLLERFRDRGHSGAHDTLPEEMKRNIKKWRLPLIAVLQQALSIPPSKEGLLDDFSFKKTWFYTTLI